ncbi:hypothetical protein BGW38_008497 [Lunasporangiospora selenospora]|uniref:YAP binding domain-containing protein n=1 Tax=Lunasporangiospora selenospora TaxID=979761 RepID=A0A9P6K9I0_9FUNG|nr:hypothetical protein BGW38_008497 [Lunasporangiospora selenospora]
MVHGAKSMLGGLGGLHGLSGLNGLHGINGLGAGLAGVDLLSSSGALPCSGLPLSLPMSLPPHRSSPLHPGQFQSPYSQAKRHRHSQSMSSFLSPTLSKTCFGADNNNNKSMNRSPLGMGHSIYPHSGLAPDSAVSLSSDLPWKPASVSTSSSTQLATCNEDGSSEMTSSTALESSQGALTQTNGLNNSNNNSSNSSRSSSCMGSSSMSSMSTFVCDDATMGDFTAEMSYPFWPSVFGLFTEYIPESAVPVVATAAAGSSGSGSSTTPATVPQIHSLARSRDLGQQSFGTVNVHQLPQEKFPSLYELYQKTMCTFLFFKIKLDLNLRLDPSSGLNVQDPSSVMGCPPGGGGGASAGGVFGNTALFDSLERRTVECTTSIFSFGSKVLEAKELRHAARIDHKFVYNFEFVNQFFGAFLNGIRSLTTWDEVDIALNNLSVVQVFEDKDTRFENPAPLLVMAFDFERGQGDIETYFIADGSDMLETLVC